MLSFDNCRSSLAKAISFAFAYALSLLPVYAATSNDIANGYCRLQQRLVQHGATLFDIGGAAIS